MAAARLEEITGMREELIRKACAMAMKTCKYPDKQYLVEKSRSSLDVIFSFPGVWSANDWFTQKPFGETKIDRSQFPSLRSVGNDEDATVNEAFLKRCEATLTNPLQHEVEKAVNEKKQIVFTGHSSGGAVAIFMTVWFLEKYIKSDSNQVLPLCVTFGSPLVGDRIFNHAIRRENWMQQFVHFVTKNDIVPRIMLAPRSSIQQALPQILDFLNPKPSLPSQESSREQVALEFYGTVMRHAAAVASHAACKLMGNTNPLLETVSSFIELSPYRPFGTYVFCTGNGKLVGVNNPDAVLQLLFYSSQLTYEGEGILAANRSLKDHQVYQSELQGSLVINHLDHLDKLPLSSDSADAESIAINMVLNDLSQSTRARLCLRAAGEVEKQKLENQKKIDHKTVAIAKGLQELEAYKVRCEARKVGYYDAFKISKQVDDFHANVKRLELAGLWDEVIEMIKKYELPDGFESRKEWVEIGTRYRRIVEPLDIANYYRHLKNEDTGPYLIKGRPKRYRYTQRWREHALRMPTGSSSESCFWAEVEELSRIYKLRSFEDVKERVFILERNIERWIQSAEIGKDLFLEESTFVKWWKTLPEQHKSGSRLYGLMQQS